LNPPSRAKATSGFMFPHWPPLGRQGTGGSRPTRWAPSVSQQMGPCQGRTGADRWTRDSRAKIAKGAKASKAVLGLAITRRHRVGPRDFILRHLSTELIDMGRNLLCLNQIYQKGSYVARTVITFLHHGFGWKRDGKAAVNFTNNLHCDDRSVTAEI
jgi:hypothetical protein